MSRLPSLYNLATNRGRERGQDQHPLGAVYRRIAALIGKAKPVAAAARKIAVLFYNTLRYGTAYKDPGADYYKERFSRRTIDNLRRCASAPGFSLVTSEPAVEGVSKEEGSLGQGLIDKLEPQATERSLSHSCFKKGPAVQKW